MNNNPYSQEILKQDLKDIGSRWWIFLIMGLAMMILGVIGAVYSTVVSVATVVFFGVLLLVAGFLHLVVGFSAANWKGLVVSILLGVLCVIAAFWIFGRPFEATVALTLAIAIFLIVSGILRMILAFQFRERFFWWFLMGGLISVLLGVLIWQQWPVSGLWVIGLFVSIELFLAGFSMMTMSCAAKLARNKLA